MIDSLCSENYFSPENQMKYMGSSQFKSFMECESMALAEILGEYEREKTVSLLVGGYVDAHYEQTLNIFKAKNPDLFTKGTGELKAPFKQAEVIIARLERDPKFSNYMSGEKQAIRTGEIAGILFKIKIDSYHPGKALVDLKVMKDFEESWKDGTKLNFVEYWSYDTQAAIYQTVEGNKLPFIIAATTKEREPDLKLISVPQDRLDYCLEIVRNNVKRFDDIKHGLIEPTRCERCDYCKSTKVLTEIIDYRLI